MAPNVSTPSDRSVWRANAADILVANQAWQLALQRPLDFALLVLIMIAIGLLIAPSMHHRIVERGEDSDHSHFAVIEMSLESWKLEADEADILRHRWREEASTWLWPVNVGAYVD
jgi:hypothetical protein